MNSITNIRLTMYIDAYNVSTWQHISFNSLLIKTHQLCQFINTTVFGCLACYRALISIFNYKNKYSIFVV